MSVAGLKTIRAWFATLRRVSRKWAIRRWLLWSAGIGLILIGLMVVSLPLWFPWVARPVLKSLGFEFATYRATTFTTFEMRDVRGVIGEVEIEAARVQGWLPTRWVWYRTFRSDPMRLEATVSDWAVRIRRAEGPRKPKEDRTDSTFEVMDVVEQILAEVRFWVPLAFVGSGVVDVHGVQLEVEEATWREGRFAGTVRVPWFEGVTRIAADVTARRRMELKASAEELALGTEVILVRQPGAWEAEGVMTWVGNQIPVRAEFKNEGWLPGTARIGTDRLLVPSGLVGLPEYGELVTRMEAIWDEERFVLELDVEATPEGEATIMRPPLSIAFRGQGDLGSGTVEELRVRSPWLALELAGPVRMDWWSGRWLVDPADVNVGIELREIPGVELEGMVEGRLEVSEGTGFWPEVRWEFNSGPFEGWGVTIQESHAVGQLKWPRLVLQMVELWLDDDTTLNVEAAVDLDAGTVEFGRWEYAGDAVRGLLPRGLDYTTLQAAGTFRGSLGRLLHEGATKAQGVSVPGLNPADFQVRWEGEGLVIRSMKAQWAAGESRVELDAALEVVGRNPKLVVAGIERVTLTQRDQTRYRLMEPVKLEWRQVETEDGAGEGEGTSWHLEMGTFQWGGVNRMLVVEGELDWPGRGHVTGQVAGLVLADFLDLFPWPDWAIEMQQVDFVAGWDRSPITIELNWNGTAIGPEEVPLALRGRVHGDGLGLRVEELTAVTPLAPMLTVEGRVPVFLQPDAANGWVQFDPERPMQLRAATDATGLITLPVGAAGDIYLSDPSVELELRGTVEQPEAHIRAELSRAEWRSATGSLTAPAVDRVLMDAVLRPEQLRLERFEVEVDGQPVRVTGEWPLDALTWNRLMNQGRLPSWQDASAEIRIVDATLAPFAPYLPDMLSPQGRLNLDLTVRPGAHLNGELTITNAATRPIGPLTPIRDIELRVHFDERQAMIERFNGQIGGQPVGLTGRVNLTEAGLPAFQIDVTGRNVPLVRRPGFLLRSDLDVRLESIADQPPRLSGDVRLRDGLFLQDFAALLTGRLERPPVRPPYFSVTNAPFADWRLELRVLGERFLRVRVPIFNGTISANGWLRGTMREPLVTGDARVHSGRVIFPFGALPIDQGYATLSERDPRGPVVALVASGRNFRYHVRLEVEGPAEEPLIQFSSTPPLTSEEILLMLTAGELPQREIVYSAGARAGRLATYLGREMVTRFVGDETAEERLIINTGENIAEDGKTTYSIEYRLDSRWSVVGEYDRFNALNAGLKWRVYTR